MALYKGNIRLAGIGSFPDQIQYLTQAEYDALSEEEKMNGTTYGIVGDINPRLLFNLEESYDVELNTTRSDGDNVIRPKEYDRYVIVKLNEDVALNVMTGPSTSTYDYSTTNTRMLKMQGRFIPAGYYGYIAPASAIGGKVYLYNVSLGTE